MKALILTLALLGSVGLYAQDSTVLDVRFWPNGVGKIPSYTSEPPKGPTPPAGYIRMTYGEAKAQDAIEKAAHPLPTPTPEEGPTQEQIEQVMTVADAIYSAQTEENQAAFAKEYVAAKEMIMLGRLGVAKKMIEAAQVPPELEAVRDQLAALLP